MQGVKNREQEEGVTGEGVYENILYFPPILLQTLDSSKKSIS